MSTPPPHPGPAATLDRPPPADAADAAAGPPEPRGAKFGTHQVLWGLGGLMAGLATGILGTAAESPGPAAAAPVPASSAAPSPSHAAARPVPTGTTMAGDGLFRVGADLRAGNVRAGTWRTAGALGGAAGSCYVALLRWPQASSVIASQTVTGPAAITTTEWTRAIRTSGCQPWHNASAPAGSARAGSSAAGSSTAGSHAAGRSAAGRAAAPEAAAGRRGRRP
jgi:hypothetical protein